MGSSDESGEKTEIVGGTPKEPVEEAPTPKEPVEEPKEEPVEEPKEEPVEEPKRKPKKEPEETKVAWVSVGGFCKYFDVSDTFVRGLIKREELRGVKTIGGRYKIPLSELKRYEAGLTFKPNVPPNLPPRPKKEGAVVEKKKETPDGKKGARKDEDDAELERESG